MIELTPTTALMVYLMITLATLLGIWGYHHYSSRKKKVNVVHQEMVICEYCHFTYLDQVVKPVTKCPQCDSFNRKR